MSVSTVSLTWPADSTRVDGITRDVIVSGPVNDTVANMLSYDVRGKSGGSIVVLDHDTRARSVIRF